MSETARDEVGEGRLPRRPGLARLLGVLFASSLVAVFSPALHGGQQADLDRAEALFNCGKYADCIAEASAGMESAPAREAWWHWKIRAAMETGRHAEALATLEGGLERFPASIQLRLRGRDVYRANGKPDAAAAALEEIETVSAGRSWRYGGAADRIALGRWSLLRGTDARQVLETYYDPIVKEDPSCLEAYLATGELALAKDDYGVAAEAFAKAAELGSENPAPWHGLALAYAESDPEESRRALARALEINPDHAGSLILMAENLIDAEAYEGAKEILAKVRAVNPKHPLACALSAAIAHIEGDRAAEAEWRRTALASWPANPIVDHTIGVKLSRKYRFAEAAACQRAALALDASFLPAKIELSQDLLRLGDESLGWRLAGEVHRADGYNVLAYNLVTLEEVLKRFTTLRAEGIVLRMDPHEAELYGSSALELLGAARRELCAKYEVDLSKPVLVEIFPEQKDFAIRTFGLPGGAAFLGVCFGQVVTARSPASQGGSPTNWRAVLWHEFCHAVTLAKSGNTMPRWLSEGISVHEEKQANPAWGQSMNERFRRMILEGGLVPVSALSGAFLSPPSPLHLEFAYFESALVIEYLVETYGLDAIGKVLADLAAGTSMDRTLAARTAPLEALDRAFAAFAEERARRYASGAGAAELDRMKEEARRLLAGKQWDEAQAVLKKLVELHPEDAEAGGGWRLIAEVHRARGEAAAERAALEQIAARDGDAQDVYIRLMELSSEAGDWESLARHAELALAVNPLVPLPHRMAARAAEGLGKAARAVAAYRALLALDPIDPADAHFNLARALQASGEPAGARRHALKAIEEAPRFRAAHRLLLDIDGGKRP